MVIFFFLVSFFLCHDCDNRVNKVYKRLNNSGPNAWFGRMQENMKRQVTFLMMVTVWLGLKIRLLWTRLCSNLKIYTVMVIICIVLRVKYDSGTVEPVYKGHPEMWPNRQVFIKSHTMEGHVAIVVEVVFVGITIIKPCTFSFLIILLL